MVQPGWLIVAAACLAVGCASKGASAVSPRAVTMPTPSVRVGDCADPARNGVLGQRPHTREANRDLDGDGMAESVVADDSLCTPEGNCYWNVFLRSPEAAECARYAGSLAGRVLEPLSGGRPGTPAGVRSYWFLTGGGRLLVHEYQFHRGGYVLTNTLVCRTADDDRLLCTEDLR